MVLYDFNIHDKKLLINTISLKLCFRAPEIVPHEPELVNYSDENRPLVDTDADQSNDPDDTCRLRYDSAPPPYLIDFESDFAQLNQNMHAETTGTRSRTGTSTGSSQLPPDTDTSSRSMQRSHDIDEVTRLLCDTDEQTVSVNYGSNRVHSTEVSNDTWNV